MPPIDVLWFRLPRREGDPYQPLGRFDRGRIMVMLFRGGYWQYGFVIPKGKFEEIRQKGLQAFRDEVAQVAPFVRDRVSDAVLFVEGPSDEWAIRAWGETLGCRLDNLNVTVLHMERGQYAEQKGPPRTQVLHGISKAAPVPHLFLFDRDERDEEELDRLMKMLQAGQEKRTHGFSP